MYFQFIIYVTPTSLSLSEMADESLFDFLHMEIVSHVYKEQRSSKGEMDNKVSWTLVLGDTVISGSCEKVNVSSPCSVHI